jgi:hypothetical protein
MAERDFHLCISGHSFRRNHMVLFQPYTMGIVEMTDPTEILRACDLCGGLTYDLVPLGWWTDARVCRGCKKEIENDENISSVREMFNPDID